MKKQLLVLGLLFVAANVEALTPVNQTGHYKSIPSTMTVGQKFTLTKSDHGLYDKWQISVTQGKKYLKAKGLTLSAVKPGTAKVKLTGTNGEQKNSATKSITIKKK